MKALTIKQPWASLIVEGIKPVENRKRPWGHKGPVAIHAGKNFDEKGLIHIEQYFSKRIYKIAVKSKNITGGIIGSVNMVDCVTDHDSEWFSGPYGYVFENPQKCKSIPYKGQQGVFNIDPFSPYLDPMRETWDFGGWYECMDCRNMFKEWHKGDCPSCGGCIPPF